MVDLLHAPFFEICCDQGMLPRRAVRHGERNYTYEDLLARAEEMAALLRSHGVGRGDVVALIARRGFDALAAVYGIMAAGAVYMPVDRAFPHERVAYMLAVG
jgi:non-ribosomal peptide synthetase component F